MNVQSENERKKDLAKFFILMGAAKYGETQIAKEMLNEGVDVNARFADIDKEVLERNKDESISDESDTPLLMAVKNTADFGFVKMLLERGANLNAKDSNNNTALAIAKEKGREDIVYLLENAAHNS